MVVDMAEVAGGLKGASKGQDGLRFLVLHIQADGALDDSCLAAVLHRLTDGWEHGSHLTTPQIHPDYGGAAEAYSPQNTEMVPVGELLPAASSQGRRSWHGLGWLG